MPIRVAAGIALPSIGQNWPVPLHPQEATEWCWLACAQMVGDTPPRNLQLEQCKLAETYLPGATGCCTDPVPEGCNIGGSADEIQQLYTDNSLGFVAAPVAGQPNEPQLITWLESGPVQVFWSVPDQSHVALIVGMQLLRGTYVYTVNDPWPVGCGHVRSLTYGQLAPVMQTGYTWAWQYVWHC